MGPILWLDKVINREIYNAMTMIIIRFSLSLFLKSYILIVAIPQPSQQEMRFNYSIEVGSDELLLQNVKTASFL